MPRVLRIKHPLTVQEIETGLLHPDELVRKGWLAIKRASEGWDAAKIGAEIGWSVTWVRTRIRKFNAEGPDGLLDGRRKNGKDFGLSQEQQEQLRTVLNQKPPFYKAPWSGPLVARWLKEYVGVTITDATGITWLRRLGYRPIGRKKVVVKENVEIVSSSAETPPTTDRRESQSLAIGGTRIGPPPDQPGRRAYPSDLTDAEWAVYQEFLKGELTHPGRIYEIREIVNAILYVMRTGCQWRYLPHDFPPYSNVYCTFQRWSRQGIWEQMHEVTRGRLRERRGKESSPSLGIVDTQSVKTTEKGGSADMTERRRWTGANG
jgi:transposase